MHHFAARQECTDSLRHGSRSSGREIIMSQNQSTAACGHTPADAASDSGLTCGKASCHACHHKKTPRSEAELKSLKNRLNRISGQLAGIGRMLDDNRYCGDILTQVAAVESALLNVEHVTDADADHETNVVVAECDEVVAPEDLIAAVEGAGEGFKVVDIQVA